MFQTRRSRSIALGLVLAVLLLPLPASAGGFWETATNGWDGGWAGLLGWLAGPSLVEMSCMLIDPNGCPSHSTAPPATEACAAIDPNECPSSS